MWIIQILIVIKNLNTSRLCMHCIVFFFEELTLLTTLDTAILTSLIWKMFLLEPLFCYCPNFKRGWKTILFYQVSVLTNCKSLSKWKCNSKTYSQSVNINVTVKREVYNFILVVTRSSNQMYLIDSSSWPFKWKTDLCLLGSISPTFYA